MRSGFTLWFTGLPGAGKSTLAAAVGEALAERGAPVEILDGDDVRKAMSPELGFSEADRRVNVRRVGLLARLLAKHGVATLVAVVSPYEDMRHEVRLSHSTPFVVVFVDCSLTELYRRDPKGLYAKALAGEIKLFTGVSAPYEPPPAPDLHLRTDLRSVADCTAAILAELRMRGLTD